MREVVQFLIKIRAQHKMSEGIRQKRSGKRVVDVAIKKLKVGKRGGEVRHSKDNVFRKH